MNNQPESSFKVGNLISIKLLSTESRKKVFGMIGIDSLQALELTMKTLRVEIEYWEKSQKGKFYFLDEEGAAI